MKNYYYEHNGTQGPITEEQLHQLYKENAISPQTPIIPHGAEAWSSYGGFFCNVDNAVSPCGEATEQQASKKIQLAGFFAINTKIDQFLHRRLPLPSRFASVEKRETYFEQMSNFIGHLIWIYIMVLVARLSADSIAFWCFLASVVVGFFIQKPLYHLYLMNTLIISRAKSIELMSLDFPRFYAFMNICLFIAGIIATIIFACCGFLAGPLCLLYIAITTVALLFFLLSALINLHAEQTFVHINSNQLSASMNLLHHIKYFMTQLCLVLQILSPVIIGFAFLVSFIVMPVSLSVFDILNPFAIIQSVQAQLFILFPFICGFFFYIASIIIDFVIHMCTVHEQNQASERL